MWWIHSRHPQQLQLQCYRYQAPARDVVTNKQKNGKILRVNKGEGKKLNTHMHLHDNFSHVAQYLDFILVVGIHARGNVVVKHT